MKIERLIGCLLIIGAIGVLVPFTILSVTFEYPAILRKETGEILTRFAAGGNSLIWTWLGFALGGLPLIPAYILIGQKLEGRSRLARTATTFGVAGLFVQMIGLLRWTFVVPMLASSYMGCADEAVKTASVVAFKTVHQYGGVLMGEHLGQLFTIIWTVMITIVLQRSKLVSKWVTGLGLISSAIYFMAQAELLATVMPPLPVWEPAGFLGSTLWLVWLIVIGVVFIRSEIE